MNKLQLKKNVAALAVWNVTDILEFGHQKVIKSKVKHKQTTK